MNPKHVKILKRGVKTWNKWKQKVMPPIDREADLSGANLKGANLQKADLQSADLSRADYF
jgi:uncharacterized protein YjbI with pentapeptide repeats